MDNQFGRRLARLGGAVVFALAGIPTSAQGQWNLYGTGGSFFVPITTAPSRNGGPPQVLVSLTLNGKSTPSSFILDTGSLGLVASPGVYTPGSDPMLAPYATITYSTSGANPVGSLYLTNVQINGANGQSVIARVPILGATNTGFNQLGIGFDRGGISIGPNASSLSPANDSYNMNPFLALASGPGVATMQPGYMIGVNGFPGLGLGPGVLLGLDGRNTGGYAFQQLASNGGLPTYCNTPGMNCPLQWSAQNGTITITSGGQTYNLGSASQLPDSGISYMIVNAPGNTVPVGAPVPPAVTCSDGSGTPQNCLASGTVNVYLPGQAQPAYSFVLGDTGNPSLPFGVQVTQSAPPSNLGRTFFENLNYLYDPINGFVGFQAAGNGGTTATVIPMLALQGNLTLPNGFLSSFTTFLMSGLAVQQNGSGALNGPIIGPGSLTLQGGNLALGGVNTYAGETTVNGGMLTIGSTGSIAGLLTVNAGGTFVNNGTVNAPGQWQLNQGIFSNNASFIGNLASTGAATNTGTITGSVINSGTFSNNGVVNGAFANAGFLSGNGIIAGHLMNTGVVAPGNSIGTLNIAGNYTHLAGATYQAEIDGSGRTDLLNVSGSAALRGGSVNVVAQPGSTFGPRTTYRIVQAFGGIDGAYASVVDPYPFLQSSLGYDANNVYLTMQMGGFAAAAANASQAAVGRVLDASVDTAAGDFAQVLGAMATNTLSAAVAQATLTSLSGQNYSSFSSTMVQGAALFMNNFASQVGGGAPVGRRVALAEACEVACDANPPATWGAWGGALGGLGTIGANSGTGAVTYNAGGFAAGLDRLVAPGVRVGVATGYSTGTQWTQGFSGQGTTDTFLAGLYGSYRQDRVYADGVLGYGYSDNQMWRQIFIPGLQQRLAQGRTGANQFYGQVEGGYRFDIGTAADAFITPFVRLQGYTGTQNGFTETGAQSLNLSVAGQTTNSLRSVLGAQLGGAIDLGWREKLALQFRLGWSHEYASTARPVTATLGGAPLMPFTTYGIAPQRDGAVIGFSANTAIAEATSMYLRYEGNISGQDSAHALTAGVRMTW